jgi:enoyl-CoA hydratase/carnithine racemase
MKFKDIAYETSGGIATITLNRPQKLNAFTFRMRDELLEAFDRADADDGVRAIVVTGAGRAFCAGADLSSGGKTFDYAARVNETQMASHRDGGGRVTLRIFKALKPVIAAINGPAVGIGATMTLPMDYRIGVEQARLGFVFTRRGIVPEACSTWFLPRIVGINQALDWVLSGRLISAREAFEGGLLQHVCAPGNLEESAHRVAEEIAENTSAVSVALARQMLWRMLGAVHPMQAHLVESRAIYATGRSNDAREGITSFLEKRPARFSDRPSADLPNVFPGEQELWWKSDQ